MIALEQVEFGYGHKHPLFQNLDLTLQPGNIYGLFGLNGAGKSSLLQLMAGLLFPKQGRINAWGFEPTKRSPAYLSRLFMLPEQLNVPAVSGTEFISIRAPFYPQFDQQQMQRCLQAFELSPAEKLSALSHGQQKKFLLSFGLACHASLLILDEPSNGLDIPSKTLFRQLVAESLSEEQIFVVSTHQVHDIAALIDNVLMLHQGNVLFNRSINQLSDALSMSQSSQAPAPNPDLLYSESSINGHRSVWKNTGEKEGMLDLELLFNAVIDQPDIYRVLFQEAPTQ